MTTKLKFDAEKKAAPILRNKELTPKQEIAWQQTRTAFLMKCPAFSHVFYTMMAKHAGSQLAIFTDGVPIAATDGMTLYLNPDTFFPLSLNERVFVVAHEVAHCIFAHCELMHGYQRRGKIAYADGTSVEYHAQLMNIATDLVINDMLIESKIGAYNKDWLHDQSLAVYTDSVIDAYKKVFNKAKKVGGGGGICSGNGFDDHLAPGTSQGKDAQQATAERDQNQQEWKVAIAAGVAAAKAQGKLPAGLERILGELQEPKVNWQEHIQGFFARKVGSGGYNWKRADRRFIVRPEQMYAPGRSGFGAEIVVVGIDTSGSIGPETVDMFMSEMAGILEEVRPKRLVIMWCDAKVHRVDEAEEASDLNVIRAKGAPGGGGTDMGKIFEEIDKMGIGGDLDAAVILTDGYTPFPPAAPSYPTLWGSIALQPEHFPWGEVVLIPQQARKAA